MIYTTGKFQTNSRLLFKTLFVISLILLSKGFWFAQVEQEYIANYAIATEWTQIQNLFVDIEAATKVGQDIDSAKFTQLNQYFTKVFDYFPQDYAFKLVYEQCKSLSQKLGANYSYNTLSSFMDNCHKPFNTIVKKINSSFTVTANGTANPLSWPAPLTVTFDWSKSKDPSNETIPEKNYFWYYRDIDGADKVIWNWSIVKYNFANPWTYLVHLTVRSSNSRIVSKSSDWVFDWEKTITVNVAPKTAIINIYSNWKQLSKTKKTKIWLQEALNWVTFDWSSTVPVGWREILSHERNISSSDWFKYTEKWDWLPWAIKLSLTSQWEYKISLATTDNQWNILPEVFSLVVSDPVAIIKQNPAEWTTSSTFTFDAATSYSVASRIGLYTWEVYDTEWNKIETIQWKSIKKNFTKPWTYTIKVVVEDELWQNNADTVKVDVKSTTPIAQFNIDPSVKRKYPSEFILDASYSSDVDVDTKNDSLTYKWVFSDEKNTKIIQTQNWDQTILVDFDKLWVQKVKLIVTDSYNLTSEIEKEITIASTLRPQLIAAPTAGIWWTEVKFIAKSNDNIINYEWNFWDSDTRTVQTNEISHVYSKIGVYTSKLKVMWPDGMENELEKMIFVWENWYPISAYTIKNKTDVIVTQNDTCHEIVDWNEIPHASYRVERYAEFKVDVTDSVNTKWEKSDLLFYFQPENDEIYKRTSFTWKFDELWCQFIDLTVEDSKVGKNVKDRIWFKVVNALPTLENLVMSFPEYGNEVWIWFQENTVKDIFNSSSSTLMVKLQALNAKDLDWSISYFKRYYYYKDFPERMLETKITPTSIPYVFFNVPRMPGQFMFGVQMFDDDDWRKKSEEIIWNWPTIFFPPDVTKPDIPIVTLKVDKQSVEAWDEVTFDVISKIISDRPDFIQERTIKIDFDWDGERDYTNKSDHVVHTYDKPNEDWYVPRAAVIYRGYKWLSDRWLLDEVTWTRRNPLKIIVRNWLKPRLMYDNFWSFVIFRDVSIGDVVSKEVCFSVKDCKKDERYLLYTGQYFSFEYPSIWKYIIRMAIVDQYANKSTKPMELNLTWDSVNSQEKQFKSIKIDLLSWTTFSWDSLTWIIFSWDLLKEERVINYFKSTVLSNIKQDWISFLVAKQSDPEWLVSDSSFLYYFDRSYTWKQCYIDMDLIVDSDWDWVVDNDADYKCNELIYKKYEVWNTKWKVFFEENWQIVWNEFFVWDYDKIESSFNIEYVNRIRTSSGEYHILSIPKPSFNNNDVEFFVWNNLENSILFDVKYDNPQWDCYIDTDISVDSEWKWIKDQNRDFLCNELHLVKYEPKYDSIIWRIYYQVDKKLLAKDFKVSFLDFQLDLTPEQKLLYEKITNLMNSIDAKVVSNGFLISSLKVLKDNLIDKMDTKSTVLMIQDYKSKNPVSITEADAKTLDDILNQLWWQSTQVMLVGWNEYENAKAEILDLLPANLSNEVKSLFYEFENTKWWEETQKDWSVKTLSIADKRKNIINEILDIVKAKTVTPWAWISVREDEVDINDLDSIIVPDLCKIMNYYTIPSDKCQSTDLKAIPETVVTQTVTKTWMSWLKILLIVALSLIWIAWVVVAVFAIKAKLNKNEEEEEETPVT